MSLTRDRGRYWSEEVNPYTPPDTGIDDETVAAKPQLKRVVAGPIRTFAIAVFVGAVFAGPFMMTHQNITLICVIAFGLISVWFDRLYRRR